MLQGVISGAVASPRRVLLYGAHGIGKSTWAADSPAPIFIQTEDGLADVGCDRFPVAATFGAVMDAIEALYEGEHDYRTVVVDSLDWLERLVWDKVCQSKNVPSIEDIGYAKGYVFAQSHWRAVLDGLRALRDSRGMGVILIAHSMIRRIELPDTDGFDAYTPALHRSAVATICEWVDEILFATYRVITKKTGKGFHEKAIALGDGERVVYTSERPHRVAKNRLGLPDELPLEWAAYAEHFPPNGEKKNG